MLLNRIFEGEIKPNNLAKAKKINVKFLDELYKKATESRDEEVLKDVDTIESFYNGNQWQNIKIKKSKLAFNSLGDSVFDMRSTYADVSTNEAKKPRRIVNVLKGRIEALVSVFAEVDPLPMPIPTGDFEYNVELINKLKIVLDEIFQEVNDFNSIYKVIAEGAMVFKHFFIEAAIDTDKTDSPVPIKLRYVHPKTVGVDPEAVTIDEADYVIQDVKLKYYQLKQIYDYKFETDLILKKDDEPKDMEVIEIQKFYIRFKQNGKTKWLLIPKYKKEWLKFKTNEDNKDSVIVFDDLPLTIFRPIVGERWYGKSSIVADMMSPQVEYNKAVSDQDWNWAKAVQAPTKGNIDAKRIQDANQPNGHLKTSTNEDVQPLGMIALIPQSEYGARLVTIKQDMDEIMGSIDLMQGRKPTGVYSGKLLETMQKAAQLKPKMWEEEFLKSVSTLAEKSLRLFANYIGGGSISMWDSRKGDIVDITAEDIKTGTYEIKIITKDANLMTKEARFEIIRDLMQYAKFQEFMPMYHIVRMINSSIQGFVPDDVIDLLKRDYENFKQSKLTAGTPVNGVPSPESGGQPGLPPQTAMPPVNKQQVPTVEQPIEMTEEEFNAQVANYQQQMIDSGIPEDRVYQMVDEAIAQGGSKEETLMILEELLNKGQNIIGGAQNG